MASSHESIDQSNASAGFSCAGGHHEKKVRLLLFDPFKDSTDRSDLIITPGNICIDEFLSEWLPIPSDVGVALKIRREWESRRLSVVAYSLYPRKIFRGRLCKNRKGFRNLPRVVEYVRSIVSLALVRFWDLLRSSSYR